MLGDEIFAIGETSYFTYFYSELKLIFGVLVSLALSGTISVLFLQISTTFYYS